LLRRCIEHRKGSGSSEDKNEFHTRFEEYTKTKILENGKNFYTNEVEDLIFVCIRASASSLDDNKENGIEELLENILQVIAKPPYSRK
jgi:hypothetical protein